MSNKYSNLEDAKDCLEQGKLADAIECLIDHLCQQEGIKLKREHYAYNGEKKYTAVADDYVYACEFSAGSNESDSDE